MKQVKGVRGWKISEVEALLGLGRRDIQRACYSGRGGVAILAPQDTAWGRRSYDVQDMAQLFLVKQYRRQGWSLPEIKEEIQRQKEAQRSIEDMLRVQVDRLSAQIEELVGQLLSAQALLAAMGEKSGASLEKVIARHIELQRSLDPDGMSSSGKERTGSVEALLQSPCLMDSPGMALAVELWLGPNSAEALRRAAEVAHLKTQGKEDGNG